LLAIVGAAGGCSGGSRRLGASQEGWQLQPAMVVATIQQQCGAEEKEEGGCLIA